VVWGWVPCAFSLLGSFGVECGRGSVGAPCVFDFCEAWLVVACLSEASFPRLSERSESRGSGLQGLGARGAVCVCLCVELGPVCVGCVA